MPIQGLRTTLDFVTDQRPKNWRETILMLYPNGKAPLTALTAAMKTKATDDPEFNWWEKSLPSQRVALGASINSNQTTITLVSGAKNFRRNHILRVEQTEELVRVSVDPSSDTVLEVERGVAGSTPTSVTYNGAGVNPHLHAVGNAQPEGSLPPTGLNYDPTKKYNFTQIYRNTLEMTRTASRTRLRTGDQVKEAKRECLELHSIEMEKSFIFGQRFEGTQDGKPFRLTGGVIQFIAAENIRQPSDPSAGADMLELEGWMKDIFAFGSNEKMAYLGNTSLLAIQQIIRKNTHWQFEPGKKEYGMDVSKLYSPFGTLVLKTHPLFNQVTSGVNSAQPYYGLDSWMLVLDMAEIVYRNMEGADTTYQPKLEANGLDGTQSGYLTEAGLEVHHPQSHFLIKKLAKGKADG